MHSNQLTVTNVCAVVSSVTVLEATALEATALEATALEATALEATALKMFCGFGFCLKFLLSKNQPYSCNKLQ